MQRAYAAPFSGAAAALTAFLHAARTGLVIVAVVGTLYVFRAPLLSALRKVGA